MLTITLIVCVVLALVGGLVLRGSVARYDPVRSRSLGPLSVELRRRAWVSADGRGQAPEGSRQQPGSATGQAVPQPCEARLRVFRVAGFCVWRQRQSVELPFQVAGMIGTLTARDFDVEFKDRFRVAGFAALLSTAASTSAPASAPAGLTPRSAHRGQR